MDSRARSGQCWPAVAVERRAVVAAGSTSDPTTDLRDERFRATVQARTADTGSSTVIVTQRGVGQQARCRLTLNGSLRCTAVFTDARAVELADVLYRAAGRSPAEETAAPTGD